MNSPGRKLIALALAAILVLAGCGGGDSTTALSKQEFLKKANSICDQVYTEVSRRYNALSLLNGGRPTAVEMNRGAQRIIVPASTQLAGRLRRLGPPEGGEVWFEKMLAALEEGTERAEEDAAVARGYGGEFAFQRAYEVMWAHGLEECGRD